jgi:hypothetical protein
VATVLFAAPSAQAAFHLMKVSEVYPGASNASPNDAFIELQMFSAGQNLVGGHKVDYYTAAGGLLGSYTIAANVTNGDDQRKILIGDTQAAGSPDFTVDQLGDALSPGTETGGAVCFPDASPPDCVSWGNFTPQAGFPNTQTANAPVIPDGQSLTRSTSPGCPDLLEASDDTDSSAADFILGAPNPQNNSVAPPTACGGAGGDIDPPNTEIKKAPSGTIEKDKAKIKFKADEKSTFECKLDKRKFKKCTSPVVYKKLDDGKHKVLIQATDDAGNLEEKPAKAKFKVST